MLLPGFLGPVGDKLSGFGTIEELPAHLFRIKRLPKRSLQRKIPFRKVIAYGKAY